MRVEPKPATIVITVVGVNKAKEAKGSMKASTTTTARPIKQERRVYPRIEFPSRMAIDLVQPSLPAPNGGVNVSAGGLCLRLERALEVKSLVRFRLLPEEFNANLTGNSRSVECTGRVAWVVQRLDLSEGPPFLFDVGIEFVDPSAVLRRLTGENGNGAVKQVKASRTTLLDSWTSHDREFIPQLTREVQQTIPWHLVVAVDGVPCFSERHKTRRQAVLALQRFKRSRSKR